MRKNKISLIALLALASVSLSLNKFTSKRESYNTLNDSKVIELDFDNNKSLNRINNKEYFPINEANYKESLKGNGLNINKNYISIPVKDLNLKESEDISMSFLFTWNGKDNIYPVSFEKAKIWIKDGYIGLSTGNNNSVGTKINFKQGEMVHLSFAIDSNNINKSNIYINGEKQEVENKVEAKEEKVYYGDTLYIGDTKLKNEEAQGDIIIDEFKLYRRKINSREAKNISAEHKIPVLSTETTNSSNPNAKLTWATEILPENILWKIGFEEGEEIDFNYKSDPFGDRTGGQKIVSEEKYEGSKSRYTRKTIDGTGNKYDAPATYGTANIATFGKIPLPDSSKGKKVSITSRIKSTANEVGIFHYTTWNYGKSFIDLGVTVTQPAKKGDTKLVIDNIEDIPVGKHITLDDDANNIKYNYEVREKNTENNTITLSSPIGRDIPAGYKLKNRPLRYSMSFPKINRKVEPNTWTLIENTTTINNSPDISYMEFPQSFRELITAYGTTYTDDLKVGYSTKVRLYRDSKKIYEGYESEFNDTSASDKTAPSNVTEIKAKMEKKDNSNKLSLSFNPAIDNGTNYKYQISAVDKNNVETPKSEIKNISITSGIKGYSYVIDRNPNTIPDNNINTTDTKIETTISNSGTYYLHIRAIDNVGNVSNTVHYKIDVPFLTASAMLKDNMIRLDWLMEDTTNKMFKVYKKEESEKEFQSISTSNLDKKVKVLNIYPTYSIPNAEGVDIAGKTLKESAKLESWINDYGMGLIEVESLNKEDFENNPDKWIKNSDGTYKYDVIAVGFWNILKIEQHLNDNGVDAIEKFIDSGRGVLVGHHHMGEPANSKDSSEYKVNVGLNKIRDKFNVEIFAQKNHYYDSTQEGIDFVLEESKYNERVDSKYVFIGTKLKAKKAGNLLNYPYKISDFDKEFIVPKSHHSFLFNKGDNWLNFSEGLGYLRPWEDKLKGEYIEVSPLTNEKGTNNSYLSTWNNVAIIQTGHSNGQATPDEQKILANTLFYLAQISEDNFLNDYSGQDVKAPTKPSVNNIKFGENGININLNSVKDLGSTYEYYVQAESKSGDSVTLSNIVKETITSGLKGYSYVIDKNNNTIPDDTVETTSNNISIDGEINSELYFHIKAIDNVGNSSETLHYKIEDITMPTLSFKKTPNTWTNGNVSIKVTAVDEGSGIKNITLPNGNIVNGNSATITVTNNGLYTFKSCDYMGNEVVQSVIVDNIDRNNPNVTINNNKNWTNKDIEVIINGTDT